MDELRPEAIPIRGTTCSELTAYEVAAHVVDTNPQIKALTLVTYHERPTWRDLAQQGEIRNLPLLLRSIQQDSEERTQTRLSRQEMSAKRLQEIARGLAEDRLLGLISRVSLRGGGSGHIPMMDFVCIPSPENLDILTRFLTEIQNGKGEGFLLESGRSYHYYGVELLSEEGWRVFLGKCLLMPGYVDDRYVGHQLVDGHCVLRLSAGKLRSRLPRVVARL